MVGALEAAGYRVEVASQAISYQNRPDPTLFEERRRGALAEADRLLGKWRQSGAAKPDLWFTYHPYCKAPDWIGPRVAAELSIPYVTAEACRTRQGADADWAEGREAVQEAVRAADINFCLKPSDEAYLGSILPSMHSVARLTPFLDVKSIADTSIVETPPFPLDGPVIVAAGMMRPGAKLQSYRLLASALAELNDPKWNIVIIGDGPVRAEIEALFAFADPRRVRFAGALSHGDVLGWMRQGDMLAWPGIGEAIGMVYLEAGACRLPVAACDVANVATVVADGESGLLAQDPTASSYSGVLSRLLADSRLRQRLGEGGLRMVSARHDIAAAAAAMKGALDPLLECSRAAVSLSVR